MQIQMQPIGYVQGGRAKVAKDNWGNNICELVLDKNFTCEALQGLDQISHIEVVFYFHVDKEEPVEFGSRHPRGRIDWPQVGIFAQHGRMRPNRIGVSICTLLDIVDTKLRVQGLDAVEGTPILDIKPVWTGYLPRGVIREPNWAKDIMRDYW